MEFPPISFIIVAHNAQDSISDLLADLCNQDYPLSQIELLLVDSGSTDKTRELMEAFASKQKEIQVKVLDNAKIWLASGINVSLAHVSTDYVIRLDAHARIPRDFLRCNMEEMILRGEDIVGGCVHGASPLSAWQTVMTALDTSRFGGGTAAFRNAGEEKYVDTLAYAMYKRKIYDEVGLYDERLRRTEDNDMNYRIRKAGYKFFFSKKINSMHTARPTFRGQLKQKWGNGFWVGKTIGIQPYCFALRHYVPSMFTLFLIVSLILLLAGIKWPLALLGALYIPTDLFFSIRSACVAPRAKPLCALCLPVLFPVLHLCYGAGMLYGLIFAPNMKKEKL